MLNCVEFLNRNCSRSVNNFSNIFNNKKKYKRFNYGFKYLCEDEAERFYSVIKKFTTENIEQISLSCTSTPTNNVNTKTTTNDSSVSATPDDDHHKNQIKCLLMPRSAKNTQNKKQHHFDDQHVTSTPMGVSIFSSRTHQQQQHQQQQNHQQRSRKISLGILSTNSGIKSSDSVSSAGTIFSSGEFSSGSRRALSHFTGQRIEKSTISCPFRCSCTDLHLTPSQQSQTKSPLINKKATFITPVSTTKLNDGTTDINSLPVVNLNSNNISTKTTSNTDGKDQQIKSNVSIVCSTSKTIGKTTLDPETNKAHTFSVATNLIQV